jgi:hypothetical protein
LRKGHFCDRVPCCAWGILMKKQKTIKTAAKKLSFVAPSKKKEQEYETDFFKWAFDQANLLKKGEFSRLDIKHLIEEIESLGKSQLDKLESYLVALLMHMLKIRYQPQMRTRSWDLSVEHATHKVKKVLEDNPSLKHKFDEIYEEAYYSARIQSVIETKLPENTFPEKCPWKIKDLFPELTFKKK